VQLLFIKTLGGRKRQLLWRLLKLSILALLTAMITTLMLYLVAHFAPDPLSDQAQNIIDHATIILTANTTLSNVSDITHNIPYCNSSDPNQVLDIYEPKTESPSIRPLVVYVHGGGWRHGDKSNSVLANYGPVILEHGNVLASLNYRLSTKVKAPSQSQDITCALTYLRARSGSLKINPHRIILMGDSAGGQLVSLEALKYESHATIAGVVDLYGVTNIAIQIKAGHLAGRNAVLYLGSTDAAVIAGSNPVNFVTPDAPPFLLIHGRSDSIVSINQSRQLATSLRSVGVAADLIEVQHAGHAFGTASGGSPSMTELRRRVADFVTSVSK
jgi:acetyl esterase/lipase